MNQNDMILQHLKHEQTICGNQMLRWGIARYAARIHELRTLGYRIESKICPYRKAHNHSAGVFQYTLEEPYV